MRNYWNLPEVTAATLRDGWLHTGDIGIMDAAGYVFVQDRLKDMIVSGGENTTHAPSRTCLPIWQWQMPP